MVGTGLDLMEKQEDRVFSSHTERFRAKEFISLGCVLCNCPKYLNIQFPSRNYMLLAAF